jgi:hypothetical protein
MVMLREFSEIRDVGGITPEQEQRICDFLQGAVYCWCKNRKDEWFSMRDLMGGDNYFWEGTPLIELYRKHEETSDDPVKEAGKDSGWLLKKVIHQDKREFDSMREELIRKYRWTGAEDNE